MITDKAQKAVISSDWKCGRASFPVIGKILPVALVLALAFVVGAAPVQEIKVEARGAAPVDPASVLAFTSVKVGQDISRSDLTRDVKELEKSGRFTFVAAQIEDAGTGVRVVYQVEQKSRISRIKITGAEEMGNQKVREWLELGAGDLVDDATLAFKSIRVREEYRKKYYPEAKLTWVIDTDRETGMAEVRVKVEEGKRSYVRDIRFSGSRTLTPSEVREIKKRQPRSVWARLFGSYDPDDLLRKSMKQEERGFWSWITGSGTYNPDDLDGDVESLRRLLQDFGLLDATVGTPAITNVSGKYIDIEIPLAEGRKYSIGGLDVRGVTLFPMTNVLKVVTNKPSDIASMAAIESSAKAIKEYYGNRGYIATQVKPVMTPSADSNRVDIAFDVKEGKKAFIHDVLIRGNSVTKDKVIRRELTVYPGDEYNEARVRNSERRLRNLGYFSFVNSVPQETSDPEKYDLAFELEEQRMGNVLVGTGFSSVDNLIGFIELSHGNFDISQWPPVGGGQKLKLRGTVGTKRRDIELSFVEPWFLDRKLSLGVDLYQHDLRYISDEYDQRTTGGNLSLGKALGTYNRVTVTYGLDNYDIYNVDSNASERIQQEAGSRLKSSVTLGISRDTRDNFFVPTRGMRSSISAELAGGPFGGDTDIYKLEAQASKYFPLWFDHVFNVRAWWSVVDGYGSTNHVPIFDREFLGGPRSLRGFKYHDVGPKDENGEPLGGKTGGYLIFEYTIPVVEKVRFATFYDIGMVYEAAYENSWSDLNSDWGIGVRFDIPNFPMRFDYAWPLQADEFNDRKSGRFQFSLGYSY